MGDSTAKIEPLLLESRDSVSGYSAIFDDDGRTAYAYLRSESEIVGDVWLYNHGEPPDEPEWNDPSKMPFANPREFVSGGPFEPVKDPSEIRFEWIRHGDDPAVRIYLRREPFAVLTPGSKPGWSKLAMKDGPLAQPLSEAPV